MRKGSHTYTHTHTYTYTHTHTHIHTQVWSITVHHNFVPLLCQCHSSCASACLPCHSKPYSSSSWSACGRSVVGLPLHKFHTGCNHKYKSSFHSASSIQPPASGPDSWWHSSSTGWGGALAQPHGVRGSDAGRHVTSGSGFLDLLACLTGRWSVGVCVTPSG